MNSLTITAQGDADGSRQGSSRAWTSYQSTTRLESDAEAAMAPTTLTRTDDPVRNGVAYRDGPVREVTVSDMVSKGRPRGPLPARVYWVRRTLVLSVALVLVFGIAHLLGGGESSRDTARVVGSDVGPSASSSGSSAGSTADAVPSPGGARADRGGKGGKPEKTETPLAQPTGPCPGSDVVVKPKVLDAAHAGSLVHLRLKLTTETSPACTWTVSPESVVVKITSGDDRIWSSQDCPTAVPDADVVLRDDLPAKVDMDWRGQRSDSTCSRQPAWAMPGFYHVEAAAFGAEPTDVQFELEQPVAPTRTAKPKPDKDDKSKDDKQGGKSKGDKQG